MGKRIRHSEHNFLKDTLRIPPDVADGTIRLVLTGTCRLWVENYRGILEYTDELICLQGKKEKLLITGKGLCIDYYTCDDMMIIGEILSIRVERNDKSVH